MSDAPECFRVDALTKQEHAAIVALWAGEATEFEQRLALHVIVNKFARAQDILFVPGKPDETAALNGRAFVGMQILKALNIPVGKLEEVENEKT